MPLWYVPMWISTMFIITSLSIPPPLTAPGNSATSGGSTWAIRRMNDKLCLEHGLSIVENPKPSRDHYGFMAGKYEAALLPGSSYAGQSTRLWKKKPKDFEEFLKKLEAAGIEVNRERRTSGSGCRGSKTYPVQYAERRLYRAGHTGERIEGTRTVKSRRTFSQKPAPKVGLLVDIEAAVRAGKGPGYERWARCLT